MGIQDIISGSFLEEFSVITIPELLTAVLLSFCLGLFITAIYRVTYSGAMFSRSLALGLVLLTMITSLVILTISSNVVLSLGMVGALSIVRFRTAVKEPLDTIFMFWAIVAGIMTGAGYVPVAVIATLLIGALFVAINLAGLRFRASAYLLVIRYDEDADSRMLQALNALPRHRVKSKNMSRDAFELVLETKLGAKQMQSVGRLREVEGVQEVNLISCHGGTML